MTFDNLADLIAYINETFTANGVNDITGPNSHDALLGIIDLISPSLQNQLVTSVAGGSLGGIPNGTTYAPGTLIETILIALLRQAVPPSYTAPAVALGTSIATLNYEVGTTISPVLSETFTQNDAGGASSRALKKNSTTIATAMPYTDIGVILGDSAPIAYQEFLTYLQGACKNDSLGTQNCTSRIVAGTISSNTITYNGYRNLFWDIPNSVPATSADIRALSNTLLNPQNGTTFNITVPTGAQNIVFAYPSTLEDVVSIQCSDFANTELKTMFTKITISVAGASGYASVNYKVYIFTPVEPFLSASIYQVTI